ncbi:hypothetical protein AGMMS50229_21100 [Campylobacterota bacterium]|nr:hypothetical protein AGMMS50229_21100 [Campylobacterota bacterium]
MIFLLCGSLIPLQITFATDYSVSNGTDFGNAITNSLSSANDTIILNQTFDVTSGDLGTYTSQKNLHIKSAAGQNNSVTFTNGLRVSPGLNLIFDSPNLNGSDLFIVQDEGLDVAGIMNLSRGIHGSAESGGYLGTGTGEHGVLTLNGPGTRITVSGNDATLSPLLGTGSLGVYDQATLAINNGELKFNGDARFVGGNLVLGGTSLLSTGTGGIFLDNGSILKGTGTLDTTTGVHLNSGSIIDLDNMNDVLNIDGGGLFIDETSKVKVKATTDPFGTPQNAKINVDGAPVVLDGTFILDLLPKYYGINPVIFDILDIAGVNTITGDFDYYRLVQDRYGSVNRAPTADTNLSVEFTPNADPHTRIARTFNQRNVGQGLDGIFVSNTTDPDWQDFFARTFTLSDRQLRNLYGELSGEIYADILTSMPSMNVAKFAFDRVGWDSEHEHVFFGPQYRLSALSNNRAVWAQFLYNQSDFDPDGNAAGYSLNRR